MATKTYSTSEDFRLAFHWAETQQDGAIPSFALRPNDKYEYQPGFGNTFESEAVPGTIPRGQNSPRVVRFGLYAEQMTGTPFTAPRHLNKRTWLYRSRPAVAHQGFTPLPDNPHTESTFLPLNPRVHLSPTQLAWHPEPIPTAEETPLDFISGLRTVAGSGDPTLREGVAAHIYLANTSMSSKAFVNSDGDMLLVPQQGALDIQTEFGHLYVQPGEICVVQRGQRFMVKVEGPSRGYVHEIWGSSWELPELGPLGANGLANARDFLHPVASYSVTHDDPWSIVYKLGGKYFSSSQQHSPFDVVAWHGNYVPFKYDLTKFVNVGSISVDHIDPSIFCVLTARSRDPAAPLADFLTFQPRWDVASHTYRPPYYHRNNCSELMGLIHGEMPGRSGDFAPGGVSFECGWVPHGVAYEQFAMASGRAPPLMKVFEGSVAFMLESSRMLTITEWAWGTKTRHEHDPRMWDDLVDNFSGHKEEVDRILEEAKRK